MQHDVEYSSCAFRKQRYGENEKKNAKTPQTVKWSSLLTLFRGNKDNEGMHSRGKLSIQNKNLVWVTKNKTICVLPTLGSQKKGGGGGGGKELFFVSNQSGVCCSSQLESIISRCYFFSLP